MSQNQHTQLWNSFTEPAAVSNQSQSSSRQRKRARIACDLCHERKVRCDVSRVGFPCANCRLDSHSCSVRAPSAKRPKKRIEIQTAGSSLTTAPSLSENSLSLRVPNGLEAMSQCTEEISLPRSPADSLYLSDAYGFLPGHKANSGGDKDDMSILLQTSPSVPTVNNFQLSPQVLTFNTCVTFSYYPFLTLRELTSLHPDDVRYLEMKGCLHVPSGFNLDQFVRQYFLHVHPCMPILDEGDFWDMYTNKRDQNAKVGGGIPLVVFQAMLFAASTFVPLGVLKDSGLENFHVARETLHQRAKLLYNFQTETHFTAIAQASLLLSFQYTAHDGQVNTSWLSTAIQHARADNSHLYYCLPGLTARQKREKKRLWWCCVLRDRVISLGVRRHMQITSDHFDFSQESVNELDFSTELERSQVYDLETKALLVKIFIVQCQLAVALTSTIMTIYPLNGVVIPDIRNVTQLLKIYRKIDDSKSDLVKWIEKSKSQLDSSPEVIAALPNSVALYADLTYIYYFSAQIALCNYTLYIFNQHHTISTDFEQQIRTTRSELQLATLNVTRRVTNLVTLGQVCYLPISVIAYTALPLVLLSLDVKFSLTKSQKVKRKHQLNIYMETMRHCGHRYDFAHVVYGFITKLLHVIDSAQSPISPQTQDGSSEATFPVSESLRPRSWIDIVAQQPQLYLKASLSLDYSLSRGRYPSDSELPGWNIGIFTSKTSTQSNHLMDGPSQTPIMSLEDFSSRDLSLLGKESQNPSQLYQHNKIIPPSSNTSPQTYCNGNVALEYEIFGMSDFGGIEFGCHDFGAALQRNEGNDTSQSLLQMLSNISHTNSAGSIHQPTTDI